MTYAQAACTSGQMANKLDQRENIRKQTENIRTNLKNSEKIWFDSLGGAWSQRGPGVEIPNFAVEILNFAVVPGTLKIHTISFEIWFDC